MKIYNEQDEEITQEDVDYDLGYLVTDYRFVAFHEAVPPTDEVGHVRVIVTFEDGSTAQFDDGYPTKYFNEDMTFNCIDEYEGKVFKDVEETWVVDTPYNPGSAEWYENEEILRYKLSTEEELEEMRKKAEQIAAEEEHAQKQTNKFDEMYEALEAVKQAFPEYVPKEAE